MAPPLSSNHVNCSWRISTTEDKSVIVRVTKLRVNTSVDCELASLQYYDGGNTNATAEHTLALLLALSRKIPEANKSTHEGLWEKKKFKGNEI